MASETRHTPGPWTAANHPGAGWEVRGVLPEGFKFDGTYRGADGKTSFQLWKLASPATILVSCERWVQFETKQWEEMQAANARLIAAAPDLLAVCEEMHRTLTSPSRELLDSTRRELEPWLTILTAAISKANSEDS